MCKYREEVVTNIEKQLISNILYFGKNIDLLGLYNIKRFVNICTDLYAVSIVLSTSNISSCREMSVDYIK